jgi:ribosomal protein S18 acetylase RimI-like enzyme
MEAEPYAVAPVPTPRGTLRLRPETADDRDFLFALHETVKGAQLPMLPGDPMRRQLLEMQFRAMTEAYRSSFPSGNFGVVTLNEAPIGRLITDTGQHGFHVVHVALLPEQRNLGLGTALMSAVLDQPRRGGIRCSAIVALDNAASLRLWSRLGFTERERSATDVIVEWRPSRLGPAG